MPKPHRFLKPDTMQWLKSKGALNESEAAEVFADLEAYQKKAESLQKVLDAKMPRPIDKWHEEYGDVLWWSFPIQEPPYCGTPLDADWPDYHTHWTPLIIPEQSNV